MNLQDYIASGILETYLLGLAGEEEARELEQLCLKYPEVKSALEETEITMEQYSQVNAVMPPANTKDQIWSAIQSLSNPSERVSLAPVRHKARLERLYPYLAAAAILLIFIGVPYHYYKMNVYRREISTLKQENLEIIVQNKNFMTRLKHAADEVNVLASTNTKRIPLAGVPGHENMQATLYISNGDQLFVRSTDLAKLPENQQYQLWAIVKGKPVSAGLIDQGTEPVLQQMTMIKDVELFAVTIEKQGGSEQPTLSQMVVAGKPLL